jgi:hypothetical protein
MEWFYGIVLIYKKAFMVFYKLLDEVRGNDLL